MNLNTSSFFNSNEVHVSSRMNEYMKKNFGYEVEGDIDTLQEAKNSLEVEQQELKNHHYMSKKYIENMLMIETITALLKAHDKPLKEDDEMYKRTADAEKGPEHYRWKNDSQLAVVIGRIEGAIDELDNAIQYRGENSAKFFNNGDKAGVGGLMGIKQKLEDIHSEWDKNTEYYGM